jgi:hypothetical protein
VQKTVKSIIISFVNQFKDLINMIIDGLKRRGGGSTGYAANLLLHLDNNVTDSGNQGEAPHTVTNTGVTFSNSVMKWGYSGVFNGSTAYLSVPDSTDWDFGTDDFTIDFWIYFSAMPSSYYMPICQKDSINYFFELYFTPTNIGVGVRNGSVNNIISHNVAQSYTTGTWYHIALVRNGSSSILFFNGTAISTVSITGTGIYPNLAQPLMIGYDSLNTAGYLNGYMDELRVLKGTAAWTANFTPPTQPYGSNIDPLLVDLVGLYHFTGNANDSSTAANNGTVTGATLTTGYDSEANGAYSYDGNDYITLASAIPITGTSYSFTFWIKPSTSVQLVAGKSDDGNSYVAYFISGTLYHRCNLATSSVASCSHTIVTNTWVHIAIVRNGNGNNITFYVDNVAKTTSYTGTLPNNPCTPNQFGVGRSPIIYMNGAIDEFRAYNRALSTDELTQIYNL